MISKIIFSTLLLVVLLAPLTSAHAQETYTLPNPLTCDTIQECFDHMTRALLIFVTPIYILMIMLAAFYFVIGGASPSNVQTAKDILKYSTIGFLVISFSRGLVALVLVVAS